MSKVPFSKDEFIFQIKDRNEKPLLGTTFFLLQDWVYLDFAAASQFGLNLRWAANFVYLYLCVYVFVFVYLNLCIYIFVYLVYLDFAAGQFGLSLRWAANFLYLYFVYLHICAFVFFVFLYLYLSSCVFVYLVYLDFAAGQFGLSLRWAANCWKVTLSQKNVVRLKGWST